MEGGELFDRVADENYILTELAVVMIISQLCEAIDYIHSQNIVHLDVKVARLQRCTLIRIISLFSQSKYFYKYPIYYSIYGDILLYFIIQRSSFLFIYR